ncbi:MAG: tyrosine-type recombinase/integrase [Chloroflexi bacterium]|nr:tyrosine-type recombinase/integrase [Chloroflexota bacterium]
MNAISVLRKKKMDTTFEGLIDLFVATKQTEGKSPFTTSWYRRRLRAVAAFLGPKATLKDLTLANARAFVAHLQARETRYEGHTTHPLQGGGLSAATIHGHVRALKAFSSWLAEENFIPMNVLTKLRRPKLPETLIEVLSEEEIEKIFTSINQNCALGARTYTMCWLLLDTGIRASELCTLTVENTNLEHNFIKVVGKGNKERRVNFGMNTRKVLLKYLTFWRPQTEEKTLFLSNEGAPITYSGLAQMITRVGKRTGIERLHCHLFRHTFAVKFLVSGGDLMTLKTLLGHTEISVTQRYLKLTQQNVAEVYSRHSPMDQMQFKKKQKVAA